jgi:chaperonin GroES
MSTTLQPTGDRVIVEALAEPEMSPGGVILPDGDTGPAQRGVVLAVGPGARLPSGRVVPSAVEEGDEVWFSSYGGVQFRDGRDEVLILREADILAKVI